MREMDFAVSTTFAPAPLKVWVGNAAMKRCPPAAFVPPAMVKLAPGTDIVGLTTVQ